MKQLFRALVLFATLAGCAVVSSRPEVVGAVPHMPAPTDRQCNEPNEWFWDGAFWVCARPQPAIVQYPIMDYDPKIFVGHGGGPARGIIFRFDNNKHHR